MNFLRILIILISFTSFLRVADAQEIQRSYYGNGGNAVHSSEITLSQTIGEPFSKVFDHYDAGLIQEIFLRQGFEQSIQDTTIFTATHNNLSFEVEIFPNPTINNISLHLGTNVTPGMQLMVYDDLGRFIKKEEEVLQTTTLDVKTFIPGIYFIHLEDLESDLRAIFPFIKL